MGVVTIGIATRYLGLEAFGAFATATAFAAMAGTLTDLGLWTVGAREIAKRPQETQRIVGNILTIGFALSAGAAAIAVVIALLLYPGEENELVRKAILLLLITVPISAPYNAASAYFVSQQKAYMAMFGSVMSSVVTLAGLVVVAALDWGFDALVLVYVVAAALQGALLIALVRGHVRLAPALDLGLSRQLVAWALPLGGAVLIHTLYWRLDMILLSVLDTKAQVALYGLGFKVVDAVVAIPTFVAITLMPEFARLASEPERFEEIMQKVWAVMQVATVGMFVLFVAYASEIARLVGGGDFTGAAPVLQLLAFAVFFSYFGSILTEAFIAHNRQSNLFWVSLGVLPLNVALNVLLIPIWGARGAALAFGLSEAAVLAAVCLLYRRFAALPRPHRLPQVVAAACAMGAVALLKLVPPADGAGPAVILFAGSALSVVVYTASLYALGAMPREVHTNLVVPLWSRVRPG